MLQDDNVRSYTTYEKINNYSCVSQYLIYINESISEISVMKHSLFNQRYASQEKFVDRTKVFLASRSSTVCQFSRASPALPRPATVNKLRSNGIPPLFPAAAATRRGGCQGRRNTVNFPVPKTGTETCWKIFGTNSRLNFSR